MNLANTNRKAFLDMIAFSEIGPALLAISDNGYNVIVGSTAAKPDLFTSYADHPRKLVKLSESLSSTAAGRYQLLMRYFDIYARQLGLHSAAEYPAGAFSPAAQDAIALQQIRERSALPLIDMGNFRLAVTRVSNIWASLPGNTYGQHQNAMDKLVAAYQSAGGTLA